MVDWAPLQAWEFTLVITTLGMSQSRQLIQHPYSQLTGRNVSEALEGTPQTNQRAELTAIIKALELTRKERDLEIITDSQYSINCVTVWYKGWMAKGWLKSDGGEVQNKDLVVSVRKLIDARDASGFGTKFTWIKGHADDPGNTAADRLAVAGATRRGQRA